MAKSKEARSTIKLKSEASDHCYFTEKNRTVVTLKVAEGEGAGAKEGGEKEGGEKEGGK